MAEILRSMPTLFWAMLAFAVALILLPWLWGKARKVDDAEQDG